MDASEPLRCRQHALRRRRDGPCSPRRRRQRGPGVRREPRHRALGGREHGGEYGAGIANRGVRRERRHPDLHAGGGRQGQFRDRFRHRPDRDRGGARLRDPVVLLGDGAGGGRPGRDGHRRDRHLGHGCGRAARCAGRADAGLAHARQPDRVLERAGERGQAGDRILRPPVPRGQRRGIRRRTAERRRRQRDDRRAPVGDGLPNPGAGGEPGRRQPVVGGARGGDPPVRVDRRQRRRGVVDGGDR